MELKRTKSNFELKGNIVGIDSYNSYLEGTNDSGEWNKISFGIKLARNSIVYIELFGIKNKKVKLYKVDSFNKILKMKDYKVVKWDNIYKTDGYNFTNQIEIQSSIENQVLISYDAVEYIRKNFKNGESVFVKGNLSFTEYNKELQLSFILQTIQSIETIDIDSENYFSHNLFTSEVIYDKIVGDKIKVLTINKKNEVFSIIEHDLLIDKKIEDQLINHFTYNVIRGQVVRLNGNILNYCYVNPESNLIDEVVTNQLRVKSGSSTQIFYNVDEIKSLQFFEEDDTIVEEKEEDKNSKFNQFGF